MKSNLDTSPARSIDLSRLIFSAKVDFVTFSTPHRVVLPELDGKVKWARKLHYKRFTLHDPSPSDIVTLAGSLDSVSLFEIEVAVDIRPVGSVAQEDRFDVLRALMLDGFAKGLDPRHGRAKVSPFRAFYRARWGAIGPFNLRLPLAGDQQLRGHRSDCVQVKAYLKYKDQGAVLPVRKWAARVEVRLSGEALDLHGLRQAGDLESFAFRKELMPYFRHLAGVRPIQNQNGTALGEELCAANDMLNQKHWNIVGTGAFLQGGRREHANVCFQRDIPMNHRIGQALHRLGSRNQNIKFVCGSSEVNAENGRLPLVNERWAG